MAGSKDADRSQTTIQVRFPCASEDGETLIVDSPPAHPNDVTLSISRPSDRMTAWIIATPETARQIAAAIIRCADKAEKYQEPPDAAGRLMKERESQERHD